MVAREASSIAATAFGSTRCNSGLNFSIRRPSSGCSISVQRQIGFAEKALGGPGQFRQHRLEHDDQSAERIQPLSADRLHLGLASVFFRHQPGLVLIDVLVGAVRQRHDLTHRAAEVSGLIGLRHLHRAGDELIMQRGLWQGSGHAAVGKACDKAGAAAGDVDDLAHQVGIYLEHEIVQVEVDVFDARAEFGGVVIAQTLGLQVLQISLGVNKRAARLGHLLAVDGEEAVGEDCGRYAEAAACSTPGQNSAWK